MGYHLTTPSYVVGGQKLPPRRGAKPPTVVRRAANPNFPIAGGSHTINYMAAPWFLGEPDPF